MDILYITLVIGEMIQDLDYIKLKMYTTVTNIIN